MFFSQVLQICVKEHNSHSKTLIFVPAKEYNNSVVSMLFYGKFVFCHFLMLFNGNSRIEKLGGGWRTDGRRMDKCWTDGQTDQWTDG